MCGEFEYATGAPLLNLKPVLWCADLLASGAPEGVRTPAPRIRSLVKTVEIIEVGYRKMRVGRGTP